MANSLRFPYSSGITPLAAAPTPPPSACHRKPRPCTRAHVLPSACHCEPVRTLVWQSASPQGNLANWRYFRQIRSTSRIRPEVLVSVAPCRRVTDCHVASLLAMTCRSLQRVRVCKDALPGKPVPPTYSPKVPLAFCFLCGDADCPVASLLAMTVGEVLAPVDTPCLLHTLRAKHPCTRAHVLPSACHCEPVRTLVWQSASPQGNLANWRYFRQIRSTSRIRPKYCFPPCPTAGEADCHVAPLLAMTCRRLARVRACKDALPGKPVTAYVFAQGAACFLLPLRGSGLSRRFAPRNDSGGGPCPR